MKNKTIETRESGLSLLDYSTPPTLSARLRFSALYQYKNQSMSFLASSNMLSGLSEKCPILKMLKSKEKTNRFLYVQLTN